MKLQAASGLAAAGAVLLAGRVCAQPRLTWRNAGLDHREYHAMVFGGEGDPAMPLNDTWLLHHATVTADPEDLVLDRGGHAEFTVEVLASGSPAFHWRRDGVALVDDDRHQGARSPTLVIDPLEVGDAGLYDCVIDNRCGSTASAAAQLTVLDPPECPDILFLRAECRDHVLKVKVKLATDAHDGLFLTVDINNVERPRLAIRGHVAKRRFRDRVNRQVVALVDPPDCGLVQDADCGP